MRSIFASLLPGSGSFAKPILGELKLLKINKDGKKPKLYNILIQAVVVTSIIVMLTRGEGHRNTLAVCLIAGGFYLAAVIQLIAAFFKQIRYNLYSYNTIYYFGFALFLLSGQEASGLKAVIGIGTIISAFMMGPMIDWFNIHLFGPMLK